MPSNTLVPALQAETDPTAGVSKRKRDVADLMVTEGQSIHAAVVGAGFSGKRRKQTVYDLRHDEAWIGYLNHRTVLYSAEQVAKAVHVRGQLMELAESEKVRLDAANGVMVTNGFSAPSRAVGTSGVSINIDLG